MANEYRPPPMSLAQRAALRSQAPRTLRQPAHRRVYPLVIAILLLLALVAAAGGFEYYFRDRVFPKVHLLAANLDVGGMTQQQVIAALQPFSAAQSFRAIDLIAPGHPLILASGARLGYRLDRGLTAWRAYQAGRAGATDLLHRARTQAGALWKGTTVPPAQRVDQVILHRYLLQLAPEVNRRARPGLPGRLLKVPVAQQEIAAGLLNVVGPFKINLPFAVLPALPLPQPVHHHHKALKHHARAH